MCVCFAYNIYVIFVSCFRPQPTPETLDNYYKDVDEIMTLLEVKGKPESNVNVDESSYKLEGDAPPKEFGSKHFRPAVIAAGKGPNTTLFGCGNAKGETLPPYAQWSICHYYT